MIESSVIEAPPPATPTSLVPSAPPRDTVARFWERRGRRVIEARGIHWGHYKGPFYSSLPFHLKVELSMEETAEIMSKHRLKGLRFPSMTQPGMKGGLYVCRPETYDLPSVNRKQRGHVKNGLEACEIRMVDPDELLHSGLALNRDTLTRQAREDATFLDENKWREFVGAVRDTPGMGIHGAFVDGRLASYIISCRDGEWLHLIYKMSRTAELQYSPNHALDFTILRNAAADPTIHWVGNGFTSVAGAEGLDRYKRQMGYEVSEHHLAIRFHSLIQPVLTSRIAFSVAGMAKWARPDDDRIGYAVQILEGARMSRGIQELQDADLACQQEATPTHGRMTRPASFFPLLRLKQTLQQGGAGYMFKRGVDFAQRKLGLKKKKAVQAPRPIGPEDVLNLQPGEWVQVKSAEEIKALLDDRNKTRGLLFTPDMRPYIGKRFRVHKRVENIFLEESKQQRKIKNTVLLENVFCQGSTFCCDRSCFLFWKESWLRRIEPGKEPSEPDKPSSELVNIGLASRG